MLNDKSLNTEQSEELIEILKNRFKKNPNRHKAIDWLNVFENLNKNSEKLWSLYQMEITGGEPDVVGYNQSTNEFIFYDCSLESPKGRRSLCYDREALDSRKEFKPKDSVVNMTNAMGIELMTEEDYRMLQKFGNFDTKTSSWLKTPSDIRALGGAIFGDFRFGRIFIYHNGAESYYAARGFRGVLSV
ncbi:MAG: DUF4256 domain-containing protein [Bacteroidota bacterium]|nr:DUF4256 domain-containing protein [Bacteroidota bacterium]